MSNSNSTRPPRKRESGWLALGILIAVAVLVTLWLRSDSQQAASGGPNAESAMRSTIAPASYRLAGRWLRTDGDYTLELQNPLSEGKLTALYFNPQPIKVGRAEWKQQGNELHVVVELRDVNYPGSTYNLMLQGDHRLRGTYFQATMGETFEVEFLRQP